MKHQKWRIPKVRQAGVKPQAWASQILLTSRTVANSACVDHLRAPSHRAAQSGRMWHNGSVALQHHLFQVLAQLALQRQRFVGFQVNADESN